VDLVARIADLATAIGADIKALFTRALPAGGTVGQVLAKSSGTDYAVQWQSPSGVLQQLTAALAADVQMPTSNVWVDGPSLTLDAGTWLLTAQVTCVRNATTLLTYYARLSDGLVTHFASTQQSHPSQNPHSVSMVLTSLVTLALSTTVKIQATTSAGSANNLMKAALAANGSGNNATRLVALKLA
jgi:hypothetical protein